MNIIKKGILATTLAASAIVGSAVPAMAQDRYRDRDDTAAIAIGAGVLGLAVGAIAASDNDRRDRRYYNRRYYDNDRRYYNNSRRYYRSDRYYDRSRRYESRWDRRRDRYDRYDRGRDYNRYYGRRGYY